MIFHGRESYRERIMREMKTVWDGLKFGMLLQLAVGPVCLFIFNEANTHGIASAVLGVLAVVMIDSLYVLLAISGIAALLSSEKIQKYLRYFGFIILLLFGLDMICGSFGIKVFPSMQLAFGDHESFIRGIIITGANPLTILFWAGVFSLKLSDQGFHKRDMFLFGSGAVLATLLFLSAVAMMGIFLSELLSKNMIGLLNVFIGAAFIAFAARILLKNGKAAKERS